MGAVSLRKAGMDDCGQIHNLQVEAFSALLGKYKDYNTNPAAESIEKIEQRMSQEFTDYEKLGYAATGKEVIIQESMTIISCFKQTGV